MRNLVEDVVRVERAVVAADAGVVAADDQVRAAVVLAEQRVQQGLARPRVAHVQRIAGLDDGRRHEVVLGQRRDRAGAHVGRDVTGLERAQQRVHQHAVADLDRDLGQVLVRAVHRVARLERGDARPAQRREQRPRLRRRHEQLAVLLGEATLRQHLDRAGQIDLGLVHHHLHARVLGVGGPEHALAFVRLVDVVLLASRASWPAVRRRRGRRRAISCPTAICSAAVACADTVIGIGQNRPLSVLHVVAHAAPVRVRHEAVQRGEAADAEHDDVAAFARSDRQPGQGAARRVPLAFRTLQQQGSQSAPPCGRTRLLIVNLSADRSAAALTARASRAHAIDGQTESGCWRARGA